VDDDETNDAQAIMNLLLHIDVYKQAATRSKSTVQPTTAKQTTAKQATTDVGRQSTQTSSEPGKMNIPIVEEELNVGKREVERGGVRVHTRVEAQPVEQQVSLHEEKVTVERRLAGGESIGVGQVDPSDARVGNRVPVRKLLELCGALGGEHHCCVGLPELEEPLVHARAEQRVPRGVPHEMDPIELVPEDSNGNLGKTFRSIRAHLHVGLVPDDFRALGRWPKYLEIAWADARKRDKEARAREAVAELQDQAAELCKQLPVRVEIGDASLKAAGADPVCVRALVERFRRALPGLLLDVALFKVQLDGAGDALQSPFPVRWKYISADEYGRFGIDDPVKLRAGDPKSLDDVEAETR